MTEIVIINQSSVLSDDTIRVAIPAFQAQSDEDVCPAWGFEPVRLSFTGARQSWATSSWPLYVLDSSDQPGALGYHQDEQGRVDGRVFAGDCLRYGASWSVDLTHELIEMLGDPKTEQLVDLPDGRKCLRELCDAVEDEAVAYQKLGVLVSNFCLPSYFAQGPGPWDFGRALTGAAPTLTPGGYLGVYDPQSGWTQITARLRNGAASRRSQRRGRTEWRARSGAR